MWANSVWGLWGLAASCLLTVLGLSPDSTWRTPLLMGAASSFVLSLLVLFWPLRDQDQRARVKEKFRHPLTLVADAVEPTHLIIFGLVIALCGAVWLSRRSTSADPHISQLQKQIEELQKKLASANPSSSGRQAASQSPPKPKVTYSERDIRELLDKLDDASNLIEKRIFPTTNAITTDTANWYSLIPNLGVKGAAEKLKRMRESLQTEVWDPINELVYSPSNRHQEVMRKAFVLDHEAAKGELSRSLKIAIDALGKLPDNPSETTRDLVKPQFNEAYRQAEIVYNWLVQARNRIATMRTSVNTQGVS